jgi:ABC-type transport system substrate-binding protein
LEELGPITDPAERKRVGDEIQLHLLAQYPYVSIYWEQEAVAFWPEVRGFVHVPSPTTGFLHAIFMWIDPAHKDDTGFKGQTSGVPGGL